MSITNLAAHYSILNTQATLLLASTGLTQFPDVDKYNKPTILISDVFNGTSGVTDEDLLLTIPFIEKLILVVNKNLMD